MMPIYGKKVTRLTSGGLSVLLINTDNNCLIKSAEAIVDELRAVKKCKKRYRGLIRQPAERTESCSRIANECYLLSF